MSNLFPLFLVFISGLGFSIQVLFVKLLTTNGNLTLFCVLVRGIIQAIISSCNIHWNFEQPLINLGPTCKIRSIMVMRSVVGYGGLTFGFLGELF